MLRMTCINNDHAPELVVGKIYEWNSHVPVDRRGLNINGKIYETWRFTKALPKTTKPIYEQSHTPGGVPCTDVYFGKIYFGRITHDHDRIIFRGSSPDSLREHVVYFYSSIEEFERSLES